MKYFLILTMLCQLAISAPVSRDFVDNKHATSHITSGNDLLDADNLGQISTLIPSNYTPAASEPGCNATHEICAHLKGVDTAIGSKAGVTSSAPANVTKSAAAVGVSTESARADHKHDISTAAPSTVGTANAEGSSTSLARADHVHSHGDQLGGLLHAEVIAAGAAGFMSGADKTKLNGIATGANNYSHPNHSGEVTSVGDGAQTLASTAITNKATETPVAGDFLLFSDTSDSGSLKKADASNFVTSIYGQNFNFAESLGVSTTSSLSYVNRLSMTTASLPAGNYMITFYGEASNTNNDKMEFIKIETDDTTIVAEAMVQVKQGGEFEQFTGNAVVTFTSGVHTIDMDWRVDANTGSLRRARINLWRVS